MSRRALAEVNSEDVTMASSTDRADAGAATMKKRGIARSHSHGAAERENSIPGAVVPLPSAPDAVDSSVAHSGSSGHMLTNPAPPSHDAPPRRVPLSARFHKTRSGSAHGHGHAEPGKSSSSSSGTGASSGSSNDHMGTPTKRLFHRASFVSDPTGSGRDTVQRPKTMASVSSAGQSAAQSAASANAPNSARRSKAGVTRTGSAGLRTTASASNLSHAHDETATSSGRAAAHDDYDTHTYGEEPGLDMSDMAPDDHHGVAGYELARRAGASAGRSTALPHTPSPRSSLARSTPASSEAAELALLRRENEALRVLLRTMRPGHIEVSPDAFTVMNHSVRRVKLTRSMSMGTAAILAATPSRKKSDLVENMVTLFSHRHGAEEYVKTQSFASDLIRLSRQATKQFIKEDRLLEISSPCYIFGDIHGNMPDLHFFSENLWSFGMELTAGTFLFLGDYVDRGPQGLEVVAYLFALKLLVPHKIFLLRGNHELRKVNGWEDYYKTGSFLHQCKARFGEEVGYEVWDEVNTAFDALPLAAVVDDKIFCSHGGIPRPVPPEAAAAISRSLVENAPSPSKSLLSASGGSIGTHGTGAGSSSHGPPGTPGVSLLASLLESHSPASHASLEASGIHTPASARASAVKRHSDGRLDAIRAVPKSNPLVSPNFGTAQQAGSVPGPGYGGPAGLPAHPAPAPQMPADFVNRVALDMMWADPAPDEMEATAGKLGDDGFGVGLRGGDTVCYGTKAIDDFLQGNDLELIVRAHQATAAGIGICKSAKVFTVFSTSKDHGCGEGATCGCLLIDHGRVLPITRSPSYRVRNMKPAHSSSKSSSSASSSSSTRSSASSGSGSGSGAPHPRKSSAQRKLDVDSYARR